ncbi:Prenytransferase ascA [Fulvia fulva]|uniref:Prenytransferase ascA n=1 Tax=Passalora fulva TaxID=5499 RepID=A0A9Q8P8D5_PASFU|nr:Prenytransferase ascA [Fulvia fulva]UJO17084.1 Prenytransferase ascA [Fulvia fulva]WPV29155.1 Prenytransferase ascA [Fulvia fulva]
MARACSGVLELLYIDLRVHCVLSIPPSNMASKTAAEAPRTAGYVAPSAGIFRVTPAAWIPYAELMRLDRAAGYYAFYWHYAIGIAFTSCIADVPPQPVEVAKLAGYLALWVVFYRGAVCAWNDNIDQEFDRQVARCRNRPIARDAVSTTQGHVFTVALAIICAAMLAPFPMAVWLYVGVMTLMLAVYPFGKRVTDFPQVILGFAFAIPIFMCSTAFGTEPLPQDFWTGQTLFTPKAYSAMCLYGANTLWTIVFDTVYAHQDIKDDIKAGVKSLAVRLGSHTKLGLGILASVQTVLLAATGLLADLGWAFFMLGCGGAGISLFAMLALVDLEKPASCAWWFGPGSRIVGASVVSGLLGTYLLRWC